MESISTMRVPPYSAYTPANDASDMESTFTTPATSFSAYSPGIAAPNMESTSTMPAASHSAYTPAKAAPSMKSTLTGPGTPLSPDTISQQIHDILYHLDSGHRWDFLRTTKPFPIKALTNSKPILSLLYSQEPGPKVDWKGLRANLMLLKPFVINTKTGPQFLAFFKSLLETHVSWVTATAKLESLRAYHIMLEWYYVQKRSDFIPASGPDPDDAAQMKYKAECDYYDNAAAECKGMLQEQELLEELEALAAKLVKYKLSKEMWKNSAILWEMVKRYASWHKAVKHGSQLGM